MSSLGVEPNELSYKAIIERAEFWLDRMRKSGCQPDAISFSSVLHACAKSGDMSRAETWLRCMEEEGVEPNATCYTEVIISCV